MQFAAKKIKKAASCSTRLKLLSEIVNRLRTEFGKPFLPATALDHLYSSVIYTKFDCVFLSRNCEKVFQKIRMLPAGFEPATFHLGGERSIQLSYGSINLGIVTN